MAALVFVIAVVLATLLPTTIGALATRALGVGVLAVEFGVWRPKFRHRFGATTVTVTPWLFTSSYAVKDPSNLDESADVPGKLFTSLHPLMRVATILVGPLTVLLICAAVAGKAVIPSLISGFIQILNGALSPFGYAQSLLGRFTEIAAQSPVSATTLLLVKFIAFMLLPIPLAAGGNALVQLVRWRRTDADGLMTLQYLGLILVGLLVVSWSGALILFGFRSFGV